MIRPGAVAIVAVTIAAAGCGKKGPPLPPLVRVPIAPAEVSVTRRGSSVAIQFVVPSSNTDGSRPADLTRVDVFALTGPATTSAEEVVKSGMRLATLRVNPARDPDEAPADDERKAVSAQPKGDGLEQGESGRIEEHLAPEMLTGADPRSYVVVGFNKRGRSGPPSTPSAVPLVEPPAPPARPDVTYDEAHITVTWPAAYDADMPSFHVYDAARGSERRLTDKPVSEPRFADSRLEWGKERCFLIRAVKSVDGLTVESDASDVACVTPKDTFPPAAPRNLQGVQAEGVVNLIWDPNQEKDLAGYIVLRAVGSEELTPVTPEPISGQQFTSPVPSGARH